MLSFEQQLDASSRKLRDSIERARAAGVQPEARAFLLERAAWAMIEIAQAWVFELRLGIPRKETESFDLLQRDGRIELDRARRFKQLCEFRSLSQREPERVDWLYLSGDLTAELGLMAEWNELALSWKNTRAS